MAKSKQVVKKLSQSEIVDILEPLIDIDSIDEDKDVGIVKDMLKSKIGNDDVVFFLVTYARDLERKMYQ